MSMRFLIPIVAIMMLVQSISFAQPSAEETALRQRVQQLERELQQLKTRHAQLRKAVMDALPPLRDRLRTPNSVDKVTKLLQGALRGEGEGSPADSGDTVREPEQTKPTSPTTPAPAAPATGKDPEPVPLPARAKPPTDGSRHAGKGFYYEAVAFVPAEDGSFECVGEMTNKSYENPVTPRCDLQVLDADGNKVAVAYFYLAFSEIDQTKIFRVSVEQKPPEGGSYTITSTIEPETDRTGRSPDELEMSQ